MLTNNSGLHILFSSAVLKKIAKNTEWKVSVFGVILVRIFPHSDWIRGDMVYLSVFSPNEGKCGPEWLRIRALFTLWKSDLLISLARCHQRCYDISALIRIEIPGGLLKESSLILRKHHFHKKALCPCFQNCSAIFEHEETLLFDNYLTLFDN